MKKFLCSKNELEIIQHLKSVPPNKIWYDFCDFIFDYDNFHYYLTFKVAKANSQNPHDEAVITVLTKENWNYKSNTGILISENEKIEEIYIVRTLLYFTDLSKLSKISIISKQLSSLFKSIRELKFNKIDYLISSVNSCNEEINCNPNSKKEESFNSKNSNLIDKGLLLKINNKYAKCYFNHNDYGTYYETLDEF